VYYRFSGLGNIANVISFFEQRNVVFQAPAQFPKNEDVPNNLGPGAPNQGGLLITLAVRSQQKCWDFRDYNMLIYYRMGPPVDSVQLVNISG